MICCCSGGIYSQTLPLPSGSSDNTRSFAVSSRNDSIIILPDQFIIPGSERLFFDSIQLQPVRDYSISVRSGVVVLTQAVLSQIQSDTLKHFLHVKYQSLPFHFKQKYQHRIPLDTIDSTAGKKSRMTLSSVPFSVDDMFESNLQKSGSIVRGLSFGSNRDLSLTSGFRMQMSGNLTTDVDILAALTDENTPIQPEGITQTLQEIDKVFVEVRSTNMSATLGDFNLEILGNEFGTLSRKLQGAKGSANYSTGGLEGNLLVSGAVTKGKFTTNHFAGSDGVQGPYRLTGDGNNRSIIVIAGSERVYVNGEKVRRGENADYIIDYTTAEVTFMTRRLINRSSRIVVDFEYSDRHYDRSLIAVKKGMQFFQQHLEVNATFLREGDNEQAPIDLVLDDTDKKILRDAGSNQNLAVRSGVSDVGAGHGQYVGFDSLITIAVGMDSLIRIYRFAPTDTLHAIYSVAFTNVGPGRGSYKKISSSQFQFVGMRLGEYEPIRYLPMPQSHLFGDIDFRATITEQLKITGEAAVMEINPNRFSTDRKTKYNDRAIGFTVQYSPSDLRIAGTNLGSMSINARERFIGRKFTSLHRINDVEFSRRWVVDDSTVGDEEIREGTLSYTPVSAMRVTSGMGKLTRGETFRSDRFTFSANLQSPGFPDAQYEIEKNRSENTLSNIRGEWIRQHAMIRHPLGIVIPHIQYDNEYLANRHRMVDTLKPGSYRFNEVSPGISVGLEKFISFTALMKWHQEDSVVGREFRHASTTFTQTYESQLRQWESFSARLNIVHEKRKFSERFLLRKNANVETILLRWLSDYTPFDRGIESNIYYEVGTERSAKMERVFQHVPVGTGSHIYLGDLNENHIVDQQDFQLSRYDGDYVSFTVPGEELVPVISVKTSTRFRINPAKLLSRDTWYHEALSALSSETFYRVEEKSTETDKKEIYLLHFSHFLSDKTTIEGSNIFTQDLFVFENNPEISLRLRYSQRRSLSRYTSLSERTYARDRSVRLRLQLLPDVATQFDYANKIDQLKADEPDNRVRNVSAQSISMDWSYHPWQELEVGFVLGVGRSLNYDTTTADLNNVSLRSVYSLENRGQVRAEITREEVQISQAPNFIPYELTEGKVRGTSWLWHFNFEYRITSFIQTSINYDGRKEGQSNIIHIGKAEVRAFF